MKSFLTFCFLALALALGINSPAQAQTRLDAKFLSPTAKDTVTVAATAVKTMSISLNGYYENVVVTSTIDRVGGTAIAGTFKLQERLNTASGWTDVSSATLSLTNVTTQSVTWRIANGIYGELRVHYTGSGSGTATARSWLGYKQLR